MGIMVLLIYGRPGIGRMGQLVGLQKEGFQMSLGEHPPESIGNLEASLGFPEE